ncbi:related to CHS5 - chitin biosynthesis protein [Melanopsichium pennsylvanicum]|uniref:Related to CHS5 - chitin biosynthesis protein n=2 Tax=Melanopsichium pennsylvanicum TaxID=63383 RepID=A0AAJ5C4N8_9BASI|nr:related to CHS5-chitin biosynthesis protein [Melanopsichium pennsylvanicum 4]SNX83867.1 related to CHS5 - chitin biosynthesis protein [Melanopsichium pennsylvanicum]
MSAHYVGQIAPNYIHSGIMQSNSADDSFTFTVGKLDAGMAILIGEKASLIEFPSLLLPPGVSSGSVVNIRVMRNDSQERRQKDEFDQLQEDILHTFGQQSPKPPNLRLRNVTQTSVTLEWDRLTLATATLLSLDIYRNGQRLAPIPNPLHNTSTKLSGLDVNAQYSFHLVLKTTAGTFSSPLIKTRTHTINDTSGISVCFGHVHDASMLEAAKAALGHMKAKWSDRIQIDTTHYVCTDPRNPGDSNAPHGDGVGAGYGKAMQLSIPAVLPHWIFACYEQKKMVGISAFYLDQDPPNASTIRASVDRVLGKSTTDVTAAAAVQDSSTSSNNNATPPPPPPPLEKDGQTGVGAGTDAATHLGKDELEAKPAPFAAEDISTTNSTSDVPSGSALGLNLTLSDEVEQDATSDPPAPPILTTTAPSDDGDVEPRVYESEVEPEPEDAPGVASAATPAAATAAPPRVVITPTDSQDNIVNPVTEPQITTGEQVSDLQKQGQHDESTIQQLDLNRNVDQDHYDNDDEDEDAEGEMDDVSLGGNTKGDQESTDNE